MTQNLAGYRILVVEDEYFLAADLDHALTMAGAEVVGPFGRVEHALAQVRGDGFELAVLDINLGGSFSYPVADALDVQGVPFVFASAYLPGELPERFRDRAFLEKPYETKAVIRALSDLIERRAVAPIETSPPRAP